MIELTDQFKQEEVDRLIKHNSDLQDKNQEYKDLIEQQKETIKELKRKNKNLMAILGI